MTHRTGRTLRRLGMVVVVTAALIASVQAAAPAQATTTWPYLSGQAFFTVTDLSGNALAGPSIRLFANGRETEYVSSNSGQDALQTYEAGIEWVFLDFGRNCVPAMSAYGIYPFHMADPVLNGDPFSICWDGEPKSVSINDGVQLRVLADASWTSGGTTWVFDHWVLDTVKTGCALGATNPDCTFALLGGTPYAFHALYRQLPTVPTYTVAPFLQPVDNLPTQNIANAGSTIPVKFSVTNATGAPVTNLTESVVAVTSAAGGDGCGTAAGSDVIEQYSGSSGLQNLGGGAYQYNWKTPKTYKGQCRTMTVSFASATGSESAGFSFK